ncbi:hypothetical protein KGV55_03680 [Candidatus Gracilibacteria bacterium]|nr:hypothetical protein [Candidatus Gracilibacteria bacterium]
MIKLVLPDASHKEDYLACIQEWREIENREKRRTGKWVRTETEEEGRAAKTGEKRKGEKGESRDDRSIP